MNMTKEQLSNELQQTEHAIKQAELLRERAMTKKENYEEQIKQTEEEFKVLGTTSKDAESLITKLDEDIAKSLEKLQSMIPYDLLKAHKLI